MRSRRIFEFERRVHDIRGRVLGALMDLEALGEL